MTKINLKNISIHRSYEIKEISELIKVNKKTCFRWIDKGLKIVDQSKKPILISGADLKEFMKNKDSKNKVMLNRNQFYCFTCKAPTYAKKGTIRINKNNKVGKCYVCGGKICRTIKLVEKDYQITSPPVQMSFL